VLWQVLHEAPGENWGLFVFMMVFTGLLTFNFAWFREQLCIVICPYGRLQSVLIDDNSMVVGYDAKRGEPRGHKGTAGAGDCIACNRCVQVCPTGIDIRQGLQLECIACTACIDACDDVMDKLDRKRGLIRYASLTQLAGGSTKWIRPRTIVYTVMLTVGTLFAAFTFSKVRPANFAVTRIVGTPYIVDDEHVRNQFLLRVVNKTNAPATFTVSVTGATGLQQSGFNEAMTLPAMAEEVHPLILSQSRSTYAGRFKFQFVLRDKAGTFELKRDAEFLGPDADLLKEQGNEREREHGEREKEHERR
jgi:cytochrome c oxidase accessory protein FixG